MSNVIRTLATPKTKFGAGTGEVGKGITEERAGLGLKNPNRTEIKESLCTGNFARPCAVNLIVC